jgi:CRP-like cAMP-binding protein
VAEDRVAAELLAGLSLFADLSQPEIEAASHALEEQTFSAGERILRQGFSGSGFYIVVEGELDVKINGEDRGRLTRGEFFGEISALLDEPPTGDVTARNDCRCLSLAAAELPEFLRSFPSVAYRLLQAEARRLKAADQWRS